MITENGWSDRGGLEDDGRIAYFHDHLEQVLDVILNEDCNIRGYSGLTKAFFSYKFSKNNKDFVQYSQLGHLLIISNGAADTRKSTQKIPIFCKRIDNQIISIL